MNSRLRKDILAETYKDMRGLVSETAFKFWKVYGGDLDDLKGQANLIFIHAVDDYDSSKGAKLSTWVAYRIKKRLLDYMRSIYEPTHQSLDALKSEYGVDNTHFLCEDFRFIDGDLDFAISKLRPNENFSVMELLDEMERDAHIVLQLFLSTPKEVIESILNDKNFRLDHTRGHMRNRLHNRLRQMGWTIRRIREAFAEIKSVTNY
jgi:DNA-directed RNA polymerase specialized sigma subunit